MRGVLAMGFAWSTAPGELGMMAEGLLQPETSVLPDRKDSSMKKLIAATALALLAACQSAPRLENDARYVKFAKVVDKYEFTAAERKEGAKRQGDSDTGLGMNLGLGTGGGFGGVMLNMGGLMGKRNSEPPRAADGANRFTVQPQGSEQRVEVMSYGHYQVGDCVKVLVGHPNEFPRLYDLKPGERCE